MRNAFSRPPAQIPPGPYHPSFPSLCRGFDSPRSLKGKLKLCHTFCFCNPAGLHRLSLNHYRIWFSARPIHDTSGKGFPDKREVVSSILTRPKTLIHSLVRSYEKPSCNHHRQNSVDCGQIVNKNIHLIARFVAVTTQSGLVSPYHKTTYNVPSTQRKRGGVYTNCRQKILHFAFGRGCSS